MVFFLLYKYIDATPVRSLIPAHVLTAFAVVGTTDSSACASDDGHQRLAIVAPPLVVLRAHKPGGRGSSRSRPTAVAITAFRDLISLASHVDHVQRERE